MKKLTITFLLLSLTVAAFSQDQANAQLVKYVTHAPDGSVAMTIIDDSRKSDIRLEMVDNFYRYEILDTKTSEPIYTAANKGKACSINKEKIRAGEYKLRLYTSNFVITSKLTISATRKFNKINANQALASVSED